ncbi:biotin/lipoyl-binding protein [Pontibacter sp. G13]|uniref:HlyD family secretion protein n=1 Tax=Pontibacter sp. G13 TaxID=3074898 RepID=UPI00288B081B|nr:biotin/lipoyl-binding protein [Pontibacter sp. G13]WNJ20022.1 biotin/lipoyl-binding protein [Pontibacter sp. G13]
MLNDSNNIVNGKVKTEKFRSFQMFSDYRATRIFARLLIASFAILLVVMFVPWTQNIQSRGFVTTLHPDQRPQMVHSVIGGRIEHWYVREGNFVEKGDTLLFLSEIKDEYFDPNLLDRTEDQIEAKTQSVQSYQEKVKALDNQIAALDQTKQLKLEQAQNYLRQAQLKIVADSIDLEAADTQLDIAKKQLARAEQLYADGLKSLTDLEAKKVKLQTAQAKRISTESKLLTSRNALINAKVELSSIENQYQDKLAKARSDKFTAMSNMFDAEATVTKMQNQYQNYSVRTGMYYLTAPQSGYVTQTIRSGIGETVKAGESLLSIMPAKYDLAVAMYIEPMDLPLINLGQPIRFMFDGWPTIVFSGWPNLSYGTFGGEVVAIDNFISEGGKYRILVAPDPNDEEWPNELRIGSGANGMALLKDVAIWYELWRRLNGFPPDYYQTKSSNSTQSKSKK